MNERKFIKECLMDLGKQIHEHKKTFIETKYKHERLAEENYIAFLAELINSAIENKTSPKEAELCSIAIAAESLRILAEFRNNPPSVTKH